MIKTTRHFAVPPMPKGLKLPELWRDFCVSEADRKVILANHNVLKAEVENDYLEYQRFNRQLMFDIACIVLADDFDFRIEKLKKFNEKMSKLLDKYATIWNNDTADMEYSYEDLDRALAASIGAENVMPFEQRYEGYMYRNRKGSS